MFFCRFLRVRQKHNFLVSNIVFHNLLDRTEIKTHRETNVTFIRKVDKIKTNIHVRK